MTVYTYSKIYSKAKECYNNTKTEYKNGISSKWSYYICKAILTPKKDVKKITIDNAPKPYGEKINRNIAKSKYIQSIKNYITFVEKNNTLPNYVTVDGVKIKPYLFTAFVSYILVKNLPSEQKLNSSIYDNPNKLYSYLTTSGCSGMGQCTGYYCACNSLQQSFYRLTNIKVDESTIAKWCGTTSSGTSHDGINTGVAQFNKKYNKKIKINWYNFSELDSNDSKRWDKINEGLKKGAVFFHLLYRNKWGHYEPIKSVGDSLTILNSLGNSCGGGTYCGYIELRSKTEQRQYINGISQKSVAILYNG